MVFLLLRGCIWIVAWCVQWLCCWVTMEASVGLFTFCMSSVGVLMWFGWAPDSRMNVHVVSVSGSKITSVFGGM